MEGANFKIEPLNERFAPALFALDLAPRRNLPIRVTRSRA
jgi:hypothetical protein